MNRDIVAQDRKVVIGADVHTGKHVVTAKTGADTYDRTQHLHPSKAAWKTYLEKFPGCDMRVVYEAGPNGFNLYDWIGELRAEEGIPVHAVVVPPAQVPKAPGKRAVKTDKRDSRSLIQALELKSFEPVVAPHKAHREERQVVRTRQALKKMETQLKNQIHGIIKFFDIPRPDGNAWTRRWVEALKTNTRQTDATGHLWAAAASLLEILASVGGEIGVLEKRMKKQIVEKGACGENARKLKKLIGIGDIAAATIATEVADFAAFRNSEAFASYVGVVPGESSSGDRVQRGRITRVGNSRLRRIFVECAWMWIRYDPEARKRYYRIVGGKDKRKYIAIVALARRLAVKAWHAVVNGPPAPAVA